MWRLLPVILLISCAGDRHIGNATDETRPDSYRIVNISELPLKPSTKPNTEQPLTKEFQRRETQGWIRETGVWDINKTVTHTRLRCAIYETGIQLGKGNPGCSQVEWLTDIDYGTRQRHCNSATLIHTGGGEFAGINGIFEALTCVRVVIRCQGVC